MMKFLRPLKQGDRGPDVEALKRATFRVLGAQHAWREYASQKLGTRRLWTFYFNRHWRKVEKQLGRPVDGRLDAGDLEALAKAKAKKGGPAFDQNALRLWALAEKQAARDPRKEIVLAARRRVQREPEISYSQARPMLYTPPPKVESRLDCSAFVTACYREAKQPDPNGYEPDYPGWGYTGTLWATGRPISVSQLEPGDLVFYGVPWMAGGAAHVALYRGGGRAYSHGSESGPREHAYNYRTVVGCRTYRLT